MKKEYTEKDYRNILRSNLAESDVINEKMQDAYEMIRNQAKVSVKRKKGMKRFIMGMSTVAAALVLSITACVANPSLAAKLPFIGHIFDTVEDDIGYKGDYSSSSEKLVTLDEIGENGSIESPYVQENNGITFTVSECNYESMAMYLAVSIEAEEGFSEELMNYGRYGTVDIPEGADQHSDYSVLYMESTASIDLSSIGYGEIKFDPAYGTSAPYLMEGKFVDDHTFAGVIRVDLMDMQILDEKEGWKEISSIPDEFPYQLNVTSIYADPEGEHLKGEWDFDLDVKLNHENTVTKKIDETNEEGVGIGTVTKTAYELYAELILPEGISKADYIVAVCDADGRPLEAQGDIAEIYSVYQRDVSKVFVYVVDYMTYMDECKGNNYQKLPEKAVFQTEVVFGE